MSIKIVSFSLSQFCQRKCGRYIFCVSVFLAKDRVKVCKDSSKLGLSWFVGTSSPIWHIGRVLWSIIKAVGLTPRHWPGFQVRATATHLVFLCRLGKCVALSSKRTQRRTESPSLVSAASQPYSHLKQGLLCRAQPCVDWPRSAAACGSARAPWRRDGLLAWPVAVPPPGAVTPPPELDLASVIVLVSDSSSSSQKITCTSCLFQKKPSKFYLGVFVISHLIDNWRVYALWMTQQV